MRRPCPQCGTLRYVEQHRAGILCRRCKARLLEAADRLEHGAWVPRGGIRKWVGTTAKEKV